MEGLIKEDNPMRIDPCLVRSPCCNTYVDRILVGGGWLIRYCCGKCTKLYSASDFDLAFAPGDPGAARKRRYFLKAVMKVKLINKEK